jgi:hypothetical protein
MVEPAYLAEKRYSYHVFSWGKPVVSDYQTADPKTTFELQVQDLFLRGYAYLKDDECYLALNSFRQLQNLILTTVHPTLPADAYLDPRFIAPMRAELIDVLAGKVATSLATLPLKKYELPEGIATTPSLSAALQKDLGLYEIAGLSASAARSTISEGIAQGVALAQEGNWDGAVEAFTTTLEKAANAAPEVQGSLYHDLAIINEKAGRDRGTVQEMMNKSADLFGTAGLPEAQVHALQSLSGVIGRGGDQVRAQKILDSAAAVFQKSNLFPIDISGKAMIIPMVAAVTPRAAPAAAGVDVVAVAMSSAQLVLESYFKPVNDPRLFSIAGTKASISLAGDVTANVKQYLQAIADSSDLALVQPWNLSYIEKVAYIPSMYFFVIPMAIGDCLVGLGNLKEAESSYLSTLVYPYINRAYELVKLWLKLSNLYLAIGDLAYRNARDNVGQYGAAKATYEKILRADKTLDAASPLYTDSKFADIKKRVQAFIAAGMPTAFADNPLLLAAVLEANLKLNQIQAAFDFFGFPPDYLPPFNWEYLQTTAKYFAQQASQIEQRYIQFKSQAENESLQRTQLDQQAEVARQTVTLEQRGLAEANAGVEVASASLKYANVQLTNAQKAQGDFASVRDELAEYAELEAWASASAVDHDDEVQLTISGYSYYNSDHKPRNEVLADLAAQRTQVTHQMEANRLQRDVDAANAYVGVAQAELDQAAARVDIANQRIAIAQLQQKDAEENRDFLDMKEFSASLWYDLAKQAKGISQKYLDMATQVAVLTERAYNAETERGLSGIRFDYSHSAADNLMGGDFLLLDLDSFTLDYITTTKTKKAPVKRLISLSDSFPLAFQKLRRDGQCFFQTELAMFDRQNPGSFLCKIRNVELVILGVGNANICGTLRNIGVSRFRLSDGSIVTRLYPADVMPISHYEIRADALAFRVDPKDLRLFENNGIDTLWQLDLPLDANDFDLEQILDLQLAIYYDSHFSPTLETTIKAALPATGSATRVTSLLMTYPDEMFYFKEQGEAKLAFDASLFPRNQTSLVKSKLSLKASGDPTTIKGLTLRLTVANHGPELVVTTDANGEVAGLAGGDPLGPLIGEGVIDSWTLRVTAADNPALVQGGRADLRGLKDIMVFFEYGFTYR